MNFAAAAEVAVVDCEACDYAVAAAAVGVMSACVLAFRLNELRRNRARYDVTERVRDDARYDDCAGLFPSRSRCI